MTAVHLFVQSVMTAYGKNKNSKTKLERRRTSAKKPKKIKKGLKATFEATSFRRSVPFRRGGFQLLGPYGEGRIRLHLAAYATRSCKHPIIESAAFL